ncbi:MAG TPA: transcription-repair coupling factor [Polyangiaceae bacterium]|nr:transcription-repair coupling factor [Polyangiaceae bacterium]
MPRFLAPLPLDRSIVSLDELARRTLASRGSSACVGVEGSGVALLAGRLLRSDAARVICVCADTEAAQRTASDLTAVTAGLGFAGLPASRPALEPLLLTAQDATPYAEARADRRLAMLRAAALFQMAAGLPARLVVTSAGALLRRVPPRREMRESGVTLEAESELDVPKFARKLDLAGYLRVPLVEDPGSFAVRGGILDVWPSASDAPVRAELYGDLVMTLRKFDPEDQRTLAEIKSVVVPPATESVQQSGGEARARQALRALCDSVDYPTTKARALIDDIATGRTFFGAQGYLPAFYELESLFDYLGPEDLLLIEDPPNVVRALREELLRGREGERSRAGLPHFPLDQLYVTEEQLACELGARRILSLHRAGVSGSEASDAIERLEHAAPDAPTLALTDQGELERAIKAARQQKGKHDALDPLVEALAEWHEAGLQALIAARTQTQADRLVTLLQHRSVTATRSGDEAQGIPAAEVRVVTAPLARGVIAQTEGYVLLTEEEIFGARARRKAEPKQRNSQAFLEDLRTLDPGDLVVHTDHGIGRYLGLERKLIGGVGVDLLVVEYAAGDKLFLPVHRLSQIQKYSAGEGVPKLDRLGGQTFSKTKARVERHVRQMADDLLRLAAERSAVQKEPLDAPGDDYQAFEAAFPFEETRDQASAIAEVLSDLRTSKVMDRLVCGDVGFGKTEVALRAAFLTASQGRQVALLCPTTVLAQQHFLTFASRFAEYPLTVKVLSRFESKSEQLETLKGLKEGSVDVLVGTHRVLSKDVHFKNLGLLVVDEEQRFGVTHKERIKQLKTSVDVLTLSATPIPRTLQQAVGGLRDMSLISTAPVDRRAIRTVVSQFDEVLIREAVLRELSRSGQVFYVYNRVEGLYERADRLKALVPEARIIVGHGQMSEGALEQTMLDFVEGKHDILVATTIIESGLDIPRANTIILDRADLFGLAQLYQLRGRVGRSNERAYCYLLVPPPSQMTDEARARIEALERHTELGSGFRIAALDMELRGAGDLLGGEQSGFVASVGFELFCHMLEEATRELRGEHVVHEVDPELSFDVEALLPEAYVAEVGVRLSLYKRLSSATDDAEITALAAEMEDRFGPPPLEAKQLVELMRLKTELRQLRVLGCEATGKAVTLHLADDTPLDPQKVGALVATKKSPYRLSPDGRLTRRALETETLSNGLLLADRMLDELGKCLKDAG